MILFIVYAFLFVSFMGTSGEAFLQKELAVGMTTFGIAITFLVLMCARALRRLT